MFFLRVYFILSMLLWLNLCTKIGEVWSYLGTKPTQSGSGNDWWCLVSNRTKTLVFWVQVVCLTSTQTSTSNPLCEGPTFLVNHPSSVLHITGTLQPPAPAFPNATGNLVGLDAAPRAVTRRRSPTSWTEGRPHQNSLGGTMMNITSGERKQMHFWCFGGTCL